MDKRKKKQKRVHFQTQNLVMSTLDESALYDRRNYTRLNLDVIRNSPVRWRQKQ